MNLIIGVTGATGTVYAVRLLEYLKDIEEIKTHLIMSKWAINNLEVETDYSLDYVYSLADFVHNNDNLGACIASGSFITDGMIILPCSMKTLSSISNGFSNNLIDRAADVMIKEGRKLVISPRETPLSPIHLENMLKLSRIGVRIVPPMPGFYSNTKSLDDIINHHVMKILDQFNINIGNDLRWKDNKYE
ncbi:UbiX family flavin prenyltransferase [Clostridium sp. D43t1_170807_H7]|uniref:UbiX family flavin prenyltransferase n=1 Tax=Clostridium sp. D43t1_170807_H7 TaxID=2787140 RepID=UPI00189A9492|nr:UbiX family flavin prenyltransferase [Clostridium sp. D43t1_170807_H7]